MRQRRPKTKTLVSDTCSDFRQCQLTISKARDIYCPFYCIKSTVSVNITSHCRERDRRHGTYPLGEEERETDKKKSSHLLQCPTYLMTILLLLMSCVTHSGRAVYDERFQFYEHLKLRLEKDCWWWKTMTILMTDTRRVHTNKFITCNIMVITGLATLFSTLSSSSLFLCLVFSTTTILKCQREHERPTDSISGQTKYFGLRLKNNEMTPLPSLTPPHHTVPT